VFTPKTGNPDIGIGLGWKREMQPRAFRAGFETKERYDDTHLPYGFPLADAPE
jgi:hypothetical protein